MGVSASQRERLPANKWLAPGKIERVRMIDYAPNQRTLDVVDVQRANGSVESVYDFQIVGRVASMKASRKPRKRPVNKGTKE